MQHTCKLQHMHDASIYANGIHLYQIIWNRFVFEVISSIQIFELSCQPIGNQFKYLN